jgi:hypothetical protein
VYEFDHMLNGRSSCQRFQSALREARREKLARAVEAAQSKRKHLALLRPILVALIHLMVR